MSQQVELSGIGGLELAAQLDQVLRAATPDVVGIASAFVSIDGVLRVADVLKRSSDPRCRLVAGIDHAITHPEALAEARRLGWGVRIGRARRGIFHPKLIVGGKRFASDGRVIDPVFTYVGSSNLTRAGLTLNVECGLVSSQPNVPNGGGEAFGELWRGSVPAGARRLKNYAAQFSERNRGRGARALVETGLAEERDVEDVGSDTVRKRRAPRQHAVSKEFAIAAWAGLESFTGEYAFQVEFPRTAGEVIRRIVGGTARGNSVDVECADGDVRRMVFRFYDDNAMFRLNIPNDVPGVGWAREHRSGLALVSRGPEGGARLRLEIIRPGDAADEIVARSIALQTWAKTPTRLYGWF